jgi:hypothetical protein
VLYLQNPANIPAGVWPVFLVKELPPGEGGYHQDQHNQPYSKVITGPGSDEWTIDASHETIEMLVDPYGNRLQNSTSIEISAAGEMVDGNSQFGSLVEACDPCEADNYGYAIQGVAVSDFITPHFYDPVVSPGTRYSFTGSIKAPRQILPGGYISWVNHETNEWQQLNYVDPGKPPEITDLGPAQTSSLRVWIDSKTRKSATRRPLNGSLLRRCATKRENLGKISRVRAGLYS